MTLKPRHCLLFLPLWWTAGTSLAATPTFTVDDVPAPIRVNGHLDDWPTTRMILLGQPSQVIYGKAYWRGLEDFNGRIFLTYDSQYLYVGAVVLKSGKVVNSSDKPFLWNGDCLELFLSTGAVGAGRQRLGQGDYHIGLSPGTECKDPQMFCFNKNKDIPGGRIVARAVKTGYLLEASIPLSFFAGLDLGPGKSAGLNLALDEGGPLSGNRIVQLDLTGNFKSRRNPSIWGLVQWIGKATAKVPEKHEVDLNAALVLDGTRGQAYYGIRTLKGSALDAGGRPLPGVKVSTWPKTKEVITDSKGGFELSRVKWYGNSVIYGRAGGYWTSLMIPPGKGTPATLRLTSIPDDFKPESGQMSRHFLGQTLRLPADGTFGSSMTGSTEWVKSLGPKILRLTGLESTAHSREQALAALDNFVAYAKEVGAEPMAEIPLGHLDPQEASAWVRHCNVDKGQKIRYWTIGDEPDLPTNGLTGEAGEPYGPYDYINDFRSFYNAMKAVDPEILILGPELAAKYTEGENDWLTPFLRYDGDIVNLVSIHRYAVNEGKSGTVKNLQESLRGEESLLWGLNDKISAETDNEVPLVVTGGNVCPVFQSGTAEMDAVTGIWAALWPAEEMAIAAQSGLGMNFFSYLAGDGSEWTLAPTGPKPSYWAQKLFGVMLEGKMIGAQIQQADMSLFATQNPTTKDVRLIIVNKTDRYFRPKTFLNGKDGDLIVDAGLNQRVDYEIPSYSISVLKIKADNSPGEVILYSRKMAQAGQAPVTSVLKPW